MTSLARLSERGFNRNHLLIAVFGLAAGGLGAGLGLLITTPEAGLVVALVSNLVVLALALARPLYALLLVVLLHPLAYHFAVIELGRGVPNLAPDRLAVVVCAALLILQMLTRQRRLHDSRINLAALLFLIAYYASFASYTWTNSRVLQYLFDVWVAPVALYFMLVQFVDSEARIDLVLNVLLLLSTLSAVYMLAENLTGEVLIRYRTSAALDFYRGTNLRITRGLYGTTTTFGNLYVLLIPVSAYFFLKARTLRLKLVYLLAFVLMLAGVYLTYKRSVWIGLLLALLIIQWFYPGFRRLFAAIVVVAALGMAASWDSLMASEAIRERVTQTDDWQDANGRTQRWEAGLEYWERSPIFGSGYRSYANGPYEQTENLYIHLLASGGLVVFIPFALMVLTILRDSVRAYRQSPRNPALFAGRERLAVFWGGFIAYFFMAYFGSGVEGHPISNLTLFTFAGAIVGSQLPRLAAQPAGGHATAAIS